ncbi:MAG: cytochrome c-type biogenesis protein CcmH [Chloroflexi bacterium]|nr:cytochrome c-type biogenesis protein CcmH [Chloroflexota bacterium]
MSMPAAARLALIACAATAIAVAGAWASGHLGGTGEPARAQDFEAQALQVEQQLMCPRCINVRLDHCELTICEDMRAEIRDQLAAGRSGDDILLYFSDRFGDAVLAELPREGFNLWLFGWVGGSTLLVAAIGATALWRMRRAAALAAAGGGSLDASEERWLDEQLRAGEGRE